MPTKVGCDVKRQVTVIIATLECLLFGMVLGGWPSLLYLIKQDGVFHYLCKDNSSNSEFDFPNDSMHEQIPKNEEACIEEEAMYNLAFTIGNSMRFLIYLPVAFLLDKFGIKLTRVLGCVAVMSGGLMLGLCTKEHPYLLVPGFSCVGISSSIFPLTNYQIASAFPRSKATVMSILGAAQAGAIVIFLLFKLVYDYAAISWNTSFIIWGSSASLTLIPTFLLLPSVLKNSKIEADITDERVSDNDSGQPERDSIKGNIETMKQPSKPKYGSMENKVKKPETDNDFMKSLLSFSFIIHCYSLVIANVNIAVYNGSFNWWINEATDDENTISALTNMLGIISMLKMVIAPLGGMLMDYYLNKSYSGNSNIRAGFLPLFIATTFQTALIISTLVSNLISIKISIVFLPFAQATYILSAFSYTRTRFPRNHFNRLIGVVHLIAVVEPLAQHGLFRLLMRKEIITRMILLGIVGISFINPFHLLCLRKNRVSGI